MPGKSQRHNSAGYLPGSILIKWWSAVHFLAKKLLETRVPLCGLGGNPREKPRKRNGLDLEAKCTHQLRI